MILNLILKDIRGYWRYIIFSIFLPATLWISILIIPHFPARGNVIFSTAAIVAAISYFAFSEKKQRLETLICSLPISRRSFVIARYLFALCVAIFGFVILYCASYATYLIYSIPISEFFITYNLKSFFIALYIISVSVSFFFPFIYKFRIMGMIFTLPIGFTLAMHSMVLIFNFTKQSYKPYFLDTDFVKIILITPLILILPIISAMISIKLYERKNI
ncbi:MAG: ABC-2 transporter permease [Ignavibacteriales bacterium]|nr:ABC-2 transporter permease [Ignavibacteriales bacterium]